MKDNQAENILDWRTAEERDASRGPTISQGERVIWKGAPNIPLLLEHPDWDRSGSQRMLYTVVILVLPLLVLGAAYWFFGSWVGAVFMALMVLCLAMVFVPPHFFFYRFLKYNKTFYTVTDQKIGLYIDYGYTKELHELHWENVRNIRYVPFKERMGTIHFVLKEAVPFYTYDFVNKEERQFPTLELVDKGEAVFKLLEDFLMGND